MIQTVKDLLSAVEAEGCTVTRASRHWMVRAPGGLYFISTTTSRPRSVKNMVAGLRRLGLRLR